MVGGLEICNYWLLVHVLGDEYVFLTCGWNIILPIILIQREVIFRGKWAISLIFLMGKIYINLHMSCLFAYFLLLLMWISILWKMVLMIHKEMKQLIYWILWIGLSCLCITAYEKDCWYYAWVVTSFTRDGSIYFECYESS